MSRPLRLEFPGAVYHVTSRGDRREPIYVDDADRAEHPKVSGSGLAVCPPTQPRLHPMSRPLRLEFPGAVYHVTSRGDRREPIYVDDVDRAEHLAVLAQAAERFDAQVLAYCQMGNHYHLVLHTRQANLSRFMRHLNGVYTQAFNRRHGLVGHLFQGRFKAILVDRDAYLLTLCRYARWGQVLSLASTRSTTSRAVTMAMPWWEPMGSRCLRSPVTISSALAATAAAMT